MWLSTLALRWCRLTLTPMTGSCGWRSATTESGGPTLPAARYEELVVAARAQIASLQARPALGQLTELRSVLRDDRTKAELLRP